MNYPLCLPEELTIYTAGEWFPRCLQWARCPPETEVAPGVDCLRVGADRVVEVDAAGVQLLLSLSRALAIQGRTLLLVEPSDALGKACVSLGTSLLPTQPLALECLQ